MTDFDAEEFRRRACTCGPPPKDCVQNDVVLVQHTWNRRKFRNQPRQGVETAVSVLMAADWTLEEVSTYVRRGQRPTMSELRRAALRRTTAHKLRDAGFAVVHTPGAIVDGPHVSVVWPCTDPFHHQEASWEDGVPEAFDACFNGD